MYCKHIHIYVRLDVHLHIFPYIFLDIHRKKKNAAKTTKFGVVPSRKVPYVHVSNGNCAGKMHDIFT